MELGLKVTRNSKKFRQPAIHFQKNECYIFAPPGTSEYIKYWMEEANRCLYGFVAEDGDRIPGYFYFYLNYFPIDLVKEVEVKDVRGKTQKRVQKERDFPSFYDYDRFFFEAVEEAELLGKHLVVIKARRKGYSFKVASMLIRNFYFIRGSKNFALASEAEFLLRDGILSKAWDGMDFLDQNTAWFKKRHKTDTKIHKRASFIVKDHTGVSTEMGYKSEIMGVTLKNDPQKARGKGGKLIIFEEAGKFPKLLDAWQIARPSVEQGSQVHGMMIAFGCVCKGTKVFTNEGIPYNIEDLVKTDGIVGYNNQKAVQQDIKAFREPYKTQCYKIVTNAGKTLECSYDHPIAYSTQKLNRDIPGIRQGNRRFKEKYWKWKKVEDFKTGDQVGVIEEVPFFGKAEIWNPRLIGWLIGDGTYGYDKTPKLSNCDEEINNYIESNFDTVLERGHITKDGKEYKETRLKGICSRLRNLGIYGQTKGNKTLPSVIWKAKKEDVQELLAGLFDTDGYITDPEKRTAINITSAYESLLNEIQLLLVKLGIHGVIERIKVNIKRPIDKNDYFRLTIRDKRSLLNFVDNIRFFPRHKQERLLKYKEVLSNHKERLSQHIQGLRFERVVFIEKIGEKEVYNLTASNTHTYVANGIVTKNTGGTEQANYEGLCELFERPDAYGCLKFKNIWDDHLLNTSCGFFIPQYANLEGIDEEGNFFMDEDGNTNVIVSKRYILKQRDLVIENASDRRAIDRHIAEQPCFSGDTLISTEDGVGKIQNNQKAWVSGIKDIYRVITKDGVFVDSTLNHEFYIGDNQYKKLENLKIGDKLVYKETKFSGNPVVIKVKSDLECLKQSMLIDEDWALFLGLFMGDGCYYAKGRSLEIVFDKKDRNSAEWTRDFITTKFGKTYVNDNTGKEMLKVRKSSVSFLSLFNDLEMLKQYKDGTHKRKVHVPSYILTGNKKVVASFLKGLFDSDGHAVANGSSVGLGNKHLQLLKDVQFLLRGFGIHSNLSSIRHLNSFGRYYNDNRLNIRSIDIPKYAKEIGFLSQRKQQRIEEFVPQLTNRDYIKGKIVSIEYLRTDEVWDITTLDHTLSANGIWAHNCSPAEATLNISTNIFPKADLQNHLSFIRNNESVRDFKQVGELLFDQDGKMKWELNPKLKDLRKHRLDPVDDRTGAIVIWEHPMENAPYGLYIIGVDPYDHDQAGTDSLGSCIIYKRIQTFEAYYDLPVAEYTGRPDMADMFYEQVRRLALYYKANIMYENEKKGLFTYFANMNMEYLLADQPDTIKDIVKDSIVQRSKGIHMSTPIKLWGEGLIRDWLIEEYAPGKKNLTKIFSEPLLEELISYSPEGNFDRVIAFMMIMVYIKELHHITVKKVKEENKKELFEHGVFRELNMNKKQNMKLII